MSFSDRDFVPYTPTSSRAGSYSGARVTHGDYIDVQATLSTGSNYMLYSGTYETSAYRQPIFVKKFDRTVDLDDFEHELERHRAVWDVHFVRVFGSSLEERHIVFRSPEGFRPLDTLANIPNAEPQIALLASSLREAVTYSKRQKMRVAWCRLRPDWIMFKGDSVLLVDWETHGPGEDDSNEEERLLLDLMSPSSDAVRRLIRDVMGERPDSFMANSLISQGTWVTVRGPRSSEVSLVANTDRSSDMRSISLSHHGSEDSFAALQRTIHAEGRDHLGTPSSGLYLTVERLTNAGRTVGKNLTRRLVPEPPATPLDAIKVLCREVWWTLWDKDRAKLKGNNGGNSFVLEGVTFESASDPMTGETDIDICAAFPIGIVYGSLHQLGYEAQVQVKRSALPACVLEVNGVVSTMMTRTTSSSLPIPIRNPLPTRVFTLP